MFPTFPMHAQPAILRIWQEAYTTHRIYTQLWSASFVLVLVSPSHFSSTEMLLSMVRNACGFALWSCCDAWQILVCGDFTLNGVNCPIQRVARTFWINETVKGLCNCLCPNAFIGGTVYVAIVNGCEISKLYYINCKSMYDGFHDTRKLCHFVLTHDFHADNGVNALWPLVRNNVSRTIYLHQSLMIWMTINIWRVARAVMVTPRHSVFIKINACYPLKLQSQQCSKYQTQV